MSTHILFLHLSETRCDQLIAPLVAAGYRVSRDDGSGPVASLLARIGAARPDLLMLDFVLLDEVFGWQLLQRLRTQGSTHALPVIVCADRVPLVQELRPHLERLGISVVLTTETGEELLAAIQQLAQQRHPPQLVLEESGSASSP